MPADDDHYMGTDEVAAKVGVTPSTIRMYLKRSRKRIAEGSALRPQDLPLPDLIVNRSPAWSEATVARWIAARPGSGRREIEMTVSGVTGGVSSLPEGAGPEEVADAWGVTDPADRAKIREMYEALRRETERQDPNGHAER